MHSHTYNRELNEAALERLVADLRVISEVGIERAAWGWDRHEQAGLDAYHAAERAALKAIEAADLGPAWEELRRRLFAMTEGRPALISWQAEHGETGHKAERAAFAVVERTVSARARCGGAAAVQRRHVATSRSGRSGALSRSHRNRPRSSARRRNACHSWP